MFEYYYLSIYDALRLQYLTPKRRGAKYIGVIKPACVRELKLCENIQGLDSILSLENDDASNCQ